MRSPSPRPALIIANGDIPPAPIVRKLAKRVLAAGGLIVCADGGTRHALDLRIRPSVIIGDLDSLPASARRRLSGVPVIREWGQENTDLEKAIIHSRSVGCAVAVVVGAVGGRIDHSTGALGCLRKYGRVFPMAIFDRDGLVRLLARTEKIAVSPGETFSLIPLSRCRGVVLTGAVFPLSGESLELGVREGISNRASGRKIVIRHASGTLLLYRLHRAASGSGRGAGSR